MNREGEGVRRERRGWAGKARGAAVSRKGMVGNAGAQAKRPATCLVPMPHSRGALHRFAWVAA